jgi:hypothetical protein
MSSISGISALISANEKLPPTPAYPNPDESDFELSTEQQESFDKIEVDENSFIRLGEITHRIFGEQVQYISFHFDGSAEYVVLIYGLRVGKLNGNYHSYKIHKEDALTFIARYRSYRRSKGRTCA